MVRNVKAALALAALAFTFGLLASVHAQDSMKHEQGQDPGNRHLPRQSPQDFRPCHDLPRGRRKAGPAPDKLQDVQRA